MKVFKTMTILSVIAVLVACSKGTTNKDDSVQASITSDGRCTQDFISSYDNVTEESHRLEMHIEQKSAASAIVYQAQILKNACDQFFAKHSHILCKVDNGTIRTKIGSATQEQKCDAAQQIIDQNN